MPDEVVLRMDRATTEDLLASMYELGEHFAAGAPLVPPTRDESERLGRLLSQLNHALGRKCNPWCIHLDG